MQIIDPGLEFKGQLTRRERTDCIVLHHADASKCTIYDIHRWHLQRDFLGCGYHFFINKLGEIYSGRPHDTIGAHAQYYNYRSLGICCEGSYMEETQPLEQVNAVVDLLVYLKKNFYPNAKIVGHRDLNATDCPGNNFLFDEICHAVELKLKLLEDEKMFVDVPQDHWAYDDIRLLHDLKIARGTGDNKFSPEVTCTRAQMASMLARTIRFFVGEDLLNKLVGKGGN